MEYNQIAQRVDGIRTQIDAAARRSGRSGSDVTLVAVSKTVGAERIRLAYDAGLRDFGENRVQELVGKHGELPPDCVWHLIGHLQSNKTRDALRLSSLIHSVDRISLAQELSRRAVQMEIIAPILVQVNISGEQTKSGVEPKETLDLVGAIAELPGLSMQGMMTIAQPVADPEEVRPAFREMRKLFDRVSQEIHAPSVSMHILSMGMSHDFRVAIEEGSTMVRVGSAIFGERKYP